MIWNWMLDSRRCCAMLRACSIMPSAMSDAITVSEKGAMANAVNPGPVAMSNAREYLHSDAHSFSMSRLWLVACGTLLAYAAACRSNCSLASGAGWILSWSMFMSVRALWRDGWMRGYYCVIQTLSWCEV